MVKEDDSKKKPHSSSKSKKDKEVKEKDKEKDQVSIYFESKKSGHIRPDCPLYKKVLKKKMMRAMVATWSDDEESSSTDEEETTKTTNLCLIGLEDKVMSPEPQTKFIFDELKTAFNELLSKFKRTGARIKTLKSINDALLKEKEN